jgi:cell division protein FtsB
MREDIYKKDLQIEVLKMTKERSEKSEKEIDQLHRKNAVLIQRVADLTGKRVLQGGTRKRRK